MLLKQPNMISVINTTDIYIRNSSRSVENVIIKLLENIIKYQMPIYYYNLDTMRWVFGRMSSLLLIKLNSAQKIVAGKQQPLGTKIMSFLPGARGWQSPNSSSSFIFDTSNISSFDIKQQSIKMFVHKTR